MRSLLCFVAACGAPSVPVANRAAPDQTWYGRQITDRGARDSTMVEYTLHRTGDRATLTVAARMVDFRGTIMKHRTYTGTMVGEVLELDASPSDLGLQEFPIRDEVEIRPVRSMRLRCIRDLRDIAPLRARRVWPAEIHGECGNVGVWSLPEERTLVLTCSELDVVRTQPRELVFGQPGIEHVLKYDDDCNPLGGGLRMIDRDRTIRAFY